jgi:hypothetical protein
MRKTWVALGAICLLWIGYTVWPLYELTVLVSAIDARDLSTVVRRINFDRVRVSLMEQMVTAYFRRSGIKPSPFAQQAVAAGASVLSPVVNKLSPENPVASEPLFPEPQAARFAPGYRRECLLDSRNRTTSWWA